MPLSIRHKISRLPKRFPVGTTFVVEGRKNNEHLRIVSRFVVLPGGRRIDLGGDVTVGTRSRRTHRRNRQAPSSAAAKKIVSERGTTLRQHR